MQHDFLHALRRFATRPAYTALIVATLGLGIGVTTAVFSVVDQTLLRPAPLAYAERLVDALDTSRKFGGFGGNSLTMQKIAGWQSQPTMFERFEGYAPDQLDVTGEAEPERIRGLNVSLGLFSMVGARPRLGRSFVDGDGRPGSERVVIISEELWRQRFGAQPDTLGRRIRLNDEDHTIVGVMPRRFHLLGEEEAVWLPVDVQANIGDTTLRGFYGLGRLAPGVRMAEAQVLADRIADRLQQELPLARTWYLKLEKKQIARVDSATRRSLFVLLGAVSFVLLITCANVANLFLSQAPLREREMAIRTALGAGRGRLIRALLTESVLLALAGGALALVLARWGIDAVLASAPSRLVFMSTTTIEIDGRVLAAAFLLTLLTGLLCGFVPAIRGSRSNLESTLRGGLQSSHSSFGRLPGSLVVLEVAFSVILLVGAALMIRTLAKLESLDPGFDPFGLIALHVDLPTDRYPTSAARAAFFDTLLDRLKTVPGVSDAAVAGGVPGPLQGGFSFGVIEGEGSSVPRAQAMVPFNNVTPSFFSTLRIPILAGRNLGANETDDAVIVSKGFADRLWPGGGAVGRRFRIGSDSPWRTIVGIAGNVETRDLHETRTSLQVYYPWIVKETATSAAAPTARQRSYDWRLLIVRAHNPIAALPEIKNQIWTVDRSQPIERIALVADLYGEAFSRQRFILLLMGSFSVIAVVLTAAGIFGVLSRVVSQRTREIGIRMALGARPSDVLKLILGRGMALTLLGDAIGVAGALLLTRVLQTLLFEVSPTDPVSFILVSVLFGAIALIACWLPARAAMRVHPAVALRTE